MTQPFVPEPAVISWKAGEFHLVDGTPVVSTDPRLRHVRDGLREVLRRATGLELPADGHADAHALVLAIDDAVPEHGYRLRVQPDGVRIDGASADAVFWGIQTLLQLLPAAIFRAAPVGETSWPIRAVEIEDAPRFRWRGLMIDVARHFLPPRDLLRYIDLMAMHKLNVLQLHLTDDQGWRMQIRRYPRLTAVGGWRRSSQVGLDTAHTDGRPHGGFYSQDDLREIVAYARERGITIVPEINMPGHSQAAIAAYPELGLTGEAVETLQGWVGPADVLNMEHTTVRFVQDVLDEVLAVFPSEYISIGGDECRKDLWRDDPRTQRRMRDLGIADEEELQSWFVHQLHDYLVSRGRRLLGWDEILEGGAPAGATVAAWRGDVGAREALRRGHDIVSCANHTTYFDYRQSEGDDEPTPAGIVVTMADVYRFDPVPVGADPAAAAHVLGGQAQVWTELLDSSRSIDYMLFPRLCAFADAVWRSSAPDIDRFGAAMQSHLARLGARGVEYRRAEGPLPWQRRPDAVGSPISRERYEADIRRITANIVSGVSGGGREPEQPHRGSHGG